MQQHSKKLYFILYDVILCIKDKPLSKLHK